MRRSYLAAISSKAPQPGERLGAIDLGSNSIRLLVAEFDPQGGIKVIDFSEVPAEALPVVAGVVARLLYDVQFWMDPERRTPISFICDEVHLYLPVSEAREPVHRVALRAFEQIAKEGRKYRVGLVVVTQRPADVSRTKGPKPAFRSRS